MHGLNFTETEEAPFIKANIFQFENKKVLEKNPFTKNYENFCLLSAVLKLYLCWAKFKSGRPALL